MTIGFSNIRVRTDDILALEEAMLDVGACVIEGSWHNGICLVRCFGNESAVRIAIQNEGYGDIVDENSRE